MKRRNRVIEKLLQGLVFLALAVAFVEVGDVGAVTLKPGDILVTDARGPGVGGSVILVDPTTGAQTTVSSGGSFVTPVGIAIAPNGDLFVADASAFGGLGGGGGGGVIRVDPTTGAQTTVSSGGHFFNLWFIAIAPNGDLFVTDSAALGGTGGLFRIDPATGAQTIVSSGGGFFDPIGLAIAANGDLLVADASAFGGGGGVIRVDPATGAQTTVSSGGSFVTPGALAIAANGDLFVVDQDALGKDRPAVIRVHPTTGAQTIVSSGGSFVNPIGIAIAANGDLLVADYGASGGTGGVIIRIDPTTGTQTTVSSGGSFIQPVGIAIVPVQLMASSDLSVTKRASPNPVTLGTNLTYTITVTNSGPDTAHGVTVTDGLPSTVTFVSATPSQGTCSRTATVTCALGTITSGAVATVTLVVRVDRGSVITNTARVTANEPDPNTANNAATATTSVANFALRVVKAGNGTGTVTSAPPGINCGTDCTENYVRGATVTLTATPALGHTFAGWKGGGCSGTGPCTLTVTANVTVVAQFTVVTLRVVKAGNGTGTVTSAPPGINCGTDCMEDYTRGTIVTLTATPSAGHTFTGWKGGGCSGTGPCTLTVTANVTVVAQFTVLTLRVQKAGNGTGTVASAPPGITCGTDCSEAYTRGTAVTLTATPDSGSTFAGWSGGCSGTATCTVTVNRNVSVIARFRR